MNLFFTGMAITMPKPWPQVRRDLTLTVLLFLLVAGPLCAQDFSAQNWYFGNSTNGIRFSRSDNSPSLITNKASLGTGASAVATDPINGNLLFYTDGQNVYDVTHNLMLNGDGLSGNPAGNQSVAVAKVPGSATGYYIFTNSANGAAGGTISYSIVDMSLPGNSVFPAPPMGEVAAKNVPIAGLPNRSEAMIIIPHPNQQGFWLITKENGTNNYSITRFDNTGGGPISTTSISLGLIDIAANFSYHPASGRIAVSPQEANRDVEILNFDPATSTLGYVQRVLNTAVNATLPTAVYDTEWSNNGQYLYISRQGEPGIQADVLQFDFLNQTTTLASVLPQPNSIFQSFGLQMAPDSAIYHLYQATSGGPFLMGVLTNTDTVASEVNYDPSAFNSNPDFGGMQFATFAAKDSIEFTVDFTSEGNCANTPVSFYPTVDPAADSLVWSFGDGQFSNTFSPVHTYNQGGSMVVEVIAYLNGDTAYASHPIDITQFDLQISMVQDTTACSCELPVNSDICGTAIQPFEVTAQAQGGTAPQYQWFGPGGLLPGETTETLHADSAGYYYVVATEGACSAYAGVNIKEYDSLDQRANIWYFGQNAGIDFNPLPENPAVGIPGPLNAPEGASVISDRNGQPIFSTDGFNIYNHITNEAGEDITPPGGIGGDPGATQSALIIPVPGDETLYYIFTTKEIYGTGTYEVRYSLFDTKLNSGAGGLAEYNQLLFGPATERLTGDANWLIAHEYGNNSFRAYRITTDGISNPVISDIGSDHLFTSAENGQGYMKLGAQNRLVVALSTPGVSNVVEVFDFIDSTGVVTNFRTADLESTTGQVYGVEVSPGGNKLYATLKDANSTMYEFAFDSLGNPYLKQSVAQTGELGAIQIGPDGQLYVAINGSGSLGMFAAAEDTTQLTNLNLQPFDLRGGISTLGLPNFIQTIANPTGQPGFNFTGLCLGDSTQFNAVGKDPAIDKFDWVFGDGQSAIDSGAQIAHLYAAAGSYLVTLTIRNKCESPVQVFTDTVVINTPPPDPSTAVALCAGELELDANPQDIPNFTYVWATGDSTETITVNQQGMYAVTVTDASGCSTDGTILTSNTVPDFDFGPNTTICENTPITPLDPQITGAVYAWTVNGAASGSSQSHTVDTSTPGIFEYKLQVTDTVTNCFVSDSITFTINESPDFTVPPPAPIACNTETGQITINFNSPTGTFFSYFISGPNGTAIQDTDQSPGASVTTTPTLPGGTFAITVTDQISNCSATTTASINNNTFTVGPVAPIEPFCDPIRLSVAVDATPGPINFPLTYRVIDNNTAAEVESGPAGTATFLTDNAGLPSNNQVYVVEVRDATNCVATSAPVNVDEDPEVPVTLVSDPCSNPLTVTATGADTYFWSGTVAIADPTSNVLSVPEPAAGTYTFNLTATRTGYCDLDTAVTLNVNQVLPMVTQSSECADQVTLTATPAGQYTYRWYRNNLLMPGGGGQQIVAGLTDNGATYYVQLVDAATGCSFDSDPINVTVSGALNFALSATPPCEGQPFTLTATANQPGVTFEWALDGAVIPGQTSGTLVETRGGLYDVTAISPSGACRVTQNFNVVPSPVTEGSLPSTGIICPDPANPDPLTREVTLDAGAEFTSYTWYRDGSPLSETTREYIATEAGTYSVDLINVYGCPSSDETLLIEDCTPRITGPNAFRPSSSVQANGDYANRSFRLFTFFIDDEGFEVFIFNRWGEMVFHTEERDFRWNGGYNNNVGQPLPTGTYTYVVRYKSSYRPEEGIQEKRGGVVLLR